MTIVYYTVLEHDPNLECIKTAEYETSIEPPWTRKWFEGWFIHDALSNHYWDECDGWDGWEPGMPLTFVVFRDEEGEQEFGRLTISVEFEPSFYGSCYQLTEKKEGDSYSPLQ